MVRKLSPTANGSSGRVILDKHDLEVDGQVDDEGNVEGCYVDYQKIGCGEYKIVLLDEDLDPIAEQAEQEVAD